MSEDTLLAGDAIASHLILRVLEREEAGWVYLAEDPDGARVRLRVLAESALTDEAVRGRILQDLATLQALEHPNLARFLAYGEEGHTFYSLEHSGSATLFDLVYHRRPLNGEELLWVARGLTSALGVLHEAGIPHGQLGATSIVLREEGAVLVDLGLDARLDPGFDVEGAKHADLLALQQVLGFAASGPGADAGDDTQALNPATARLLNALTQANTLSDASEALDRLVEDSAETGLDSAPALQDFMSLLEASDYSSGVFRRLDVPPKTTEYARQMVLEVSSAEGQPLSDTDSGMTPAILPGESGSGTGKKSDLLTSQDVKLRDDSGRHVPVIEGPEEDAYPENPPGPTVSQELFQSEETTPLVEAPAPYPRRLGDYVLLEEIGSGAGGTVHLARAKEAQNLVALRTLKRKVFKRPEDLERLWRKVDAAASLEHPVFAKTLDRGDVDGEAYLVSELVAGRNLEELAQQGVDVERGLLPQLLPVLDAVSEANDAGIVDGHLRANHVLVDGEGTPRLIDFGIGASLGKPPTSEPSDDVESAARLVYFVASGGRTPPTEGWRVKLLGQPVPPSAFVRGLRPELDAVVLKALSSVKRSRYPNVSALREDLERVLAGGVPVAPPVPPGRRAVLWVLARPWVTALLVLWAVCTLVFFVMALRGGPGPASTQPDPVPQVDPAEAEAQRKRSMAEALCEAAKQLYRADRPEAALRLYGQAALLDPSLAQAKQGRDEAAVAVQDREQKREEARQEATLALQDALAAIDEGDAEAAHGFMEIAADNQRLLLDLAGADQADAGLTLELVRLEREVQQLESGGAGGVDRKQVARLVRERLEELRAAEETDRKQRATELARQGDAALAKQDKSTATQRYLDALALDPQHAEALRGLRDALTPELGGGESGDQVAKWATDQRETLRADAERARGRGQFKRAEERLLQALAFAPRDPQLQAALEDVREQLRARQERPVGERVSSAIERGEQALERARTSTDRGTAALHYLTAQGELSAALALDPNRSDLATELAKIKDEAVDLFTPQAAVEQAPPTRPDDPHVNFEEADQVAIARALGRNVRFAPPGNVFADLKEDVAKVGKDRYRVSIRLRTRAERNPGGGIQSVRVVARGFEIQLEDKRERVRWPWKFLAFEDGPYPRATRIERDGTVVVANFFSAQPNERANEMLRLRTTVRALITEAIEAGDE